MAIDPTYLEYLQRRYAFAEWRASEATNDSVQTLDSFSGNELTGWTLQRSTRRLGSDGIPVVRGIWAIAAGDDSRLLDVEVWSCASPATAREFLLQLLGDMQGPVATRQSAGAPGDVTFQLGGDSAVLFARGRAVVRVRNAGRIVAPVIAEATQIDDWLQGKGRR